VFSIEAAASEIKEILFDETATTQAIILPQARSDQVAGEPGHRHTPRLCLVI
jgi:hypothetical protein